ncbi:nucleotidyltransferase family protein [candidate division KSB1 bacterium]|nr:nucleotidyltransferase family protein [candidate division KSB1 bacterium]MBL7093431.1 nucleotidyltransferase family protein [candidate division KSB1 bacterium]
MKLCDEDKLLLYCSKILSENSNTDELTQLIQKKLNWKKVVKKAKRHSIASAMYCILSNLPNNKLIQEKYLLELKEDYLDTLGRNTIAFNELNVLLKIFKQANIEVVLLKGAALLASVYPDVAYRFMSDIDILVRDSDLSKARDCLLSHGYTQNISPYNLQKKKSHHLPPFWNPAKNIRIEMHWTIRISDSDFNINMAEVWSRIQKTKTGEADTFLLSPEDMILHLSFHLFFSNVNVMIFRTLYDIAAIFQYYGETIDGKLITNCSIKYGLETPVYAVLFLLKTQLSINVPAEVLSQLHAKSSTIQLNRMKVFHKQTALENVGRNIYDTRGLKRKISFIFFLIFPSLNYVAHKYSLPANSKIVYLYYFIRPFHLLYKYIISALKTIGKFANLFYRNISNQKIEKSINNIFAKR